MRWVLFVAIVALAGMLGGAVAYLVLSRTDSAPTVIESETAQPPVGSGSAPPPADPSEPLTPPSAPTIDEAALLAEVAELSEFVEQARGLEFQTPVDVEILDGAAFAARLLDEFDDEVVEELELTGRILSALGMIESGTDLPGALENLYGEGVLGFYDTETKELVVRGGDLNPYVRQTIVHELVHALDDQWFDLRREEYDDRLDEIAAGLLSVVEGNAVRIETLWLDTLTPAERAERDLEEARFGLSMDVSAVPPVLFELLYAPYEEGGMFVQQLVDLGGEQAVNDALVDPPETTEQVLHFEKFLTGEPRIEVTPPPIEGELLDEGVFGQRMLRIMLATRLFGSDARSAATGWGGDWYVAYEPDEGGTCVRVDFAMDTPGDLIELTDALDAYIEELPLATVESVGSDLVRLTSCDDTAAAGGGGSPL